VNFGAYFCIASLLLVCVLIACSVIAQLKTFVAIGRRVMGVTRRITPEAALEIGKLALVNEGLMSVEGQVKIVRETVRYYTVYEKTDKIPLRRFLRGCLVSVETGKVTVIKMPLR